jgi:hypothetical protein
VRRALQQCRARRSLARLILVRAHASSLPELRVRTWRSTREALHAYARVAGAIRAALAPPEKHWYHVSLRVAASGLTTTPLPAAAATFEITIECATSRWVIATSSGVRWGVPLCGQSALALLAETEILLKPMGVRAHVDRKQLGRQPLRGFDPGAAARYWSALSWIDAQFKRFKAAERRETSPVQLWPHHFDLAFLVFSGRKIPGEDPDDPGLSDEQMNFGFVPGDHAIREPYFYVTAYPEPVNRRQPRLPRGARWHTRGWQGAVLPYEALVATRQPQERLLDFLRAARAWGDF